ncbi:hypothetical protein GCM10027037_13630 [Mucilaginibacter koreensis]
MQNEYQRLLAVNRFKHFTEGIRRDLDALTNLVAQICEVPVALVTIIDDQTQWFTAKYGVDIDSNERELSFCNTTIAQPDLLIVPDAQQDERFSNLPVVKNQPNIRFYAGSALNTYDGQAIGTVCVLDVKPRELNDMQKDALRAISRQVVNVLELNWSLRNLAEQYDALQAEKQLISLQLKQISAAFNSFAYPCVIIDQQHKLAAFNKAAATYSNIHYPMPLEEGRPLISYISEDKGRRLMVYIDQALAGHEHQVQWQTQNTGENSRLSVNFVPLRDDMENIIGVMIRTEAIKPTGEIQQ